MKIELDYFTVNEWRNVNRMIVDVWVHTLHGWIQGHAHLDGSNTVFEDLDGAKITDVLGYIHIPSVAGVERRLH